METMNFRIKEICDQKGITFTDLAQRSGIARESLSGQVFKNPTLKTLSKIADVLGVEVYELFEIKPNIDELKPFGSVRVGNQVRLINSIQDLELLLEEIKGGQ
jgi:transcriptional regulator with XRE-family HTH domain